VASLAFRVRTGTSERQCSTHKIGISLLVLAFLAKLAAEFLRCTKQSSLIRSSAKDPGQGGTNGTQLYKRSDIADMESLLAEDFTSRWKMAAPSAVGVHRATRRPDA